MFDMVLNAPLDILMDIVLMSLLLSLSLYLLTGTRAYEQQPN